VKEPGPKGPEQWALPMGSPAVRMLELLLGQQQHASPSVGQDLPPARPESGPAVWLPLFLEQAGETAPHRLPEPDLEPDPRRDPAPELAASRIVSLGTAPAEMSPSVEPEQAAWVLE
jgi:hypothetical protein